MGKPDLADGFFDHKITFGDASEHPSIDDMVKETHQSSVKDKITEHTTYRACETEDSVLLNFVVVVKKPYDKLVESHISSEIEEINDAIMYPHGKICEEEEWVNQI